MNFRLTLILIIITILATVNQSDGQSKRRAAIAARYNNFQIPGRVKLDKGSPAGTTIHVINLDTNQSEKEIVVTSSGKFDVELGYFREYKLVVSKEGFYEKELEISTVVPRDVWEKDSIFPPMPVVLTLYKKVSDVKLSFEGKPVGKISYSPNGSLDNFDASLYIDDQVILDEINTAVKTVGDDEFDHKMAEALEYEKKNELSTALSVYGEAQKIKPSDKFVKEKIKELASDLKNLENEGKMQAEFSRLLALGDENVVNQKFYEAIQFYKGAIKIKGNDSGAISKLSAAEKQYAMIGEKAKLDALINKQMAIGEANFSQSKYADAINSFKEVLKIKADHTPALTRIQEAENLLANERSEQEKLEAEFKRLTSLGNDNLSQSKYNEAIGNYKGALAIKAEDKATLASLNKAENLRASEQSAKTRQDAEFARLIELGDQNLSQSKYVLANTNFNGALALKPGDPSTLARLTNVRNLMESHKIEIAKQEAEFNRLVASGDENVTQQKYSAAIGNFKDALKIKTDDASTLNRLSKAENLLAAEQNANSKKEAEVQRLLSIGDQAVNQLKYSEALISFKDASVIKPGEPAIQERISKTENLIAKDQTEKANQEVEFDRLVSTGDESFSQLKYADAISYFKGALVIKPGDPSVLSRITKSENLLSISLSEKAKKEEEFNRLVAIGDQNLNQSKYKEAITSYNQALIIKPGEQSVLAKVDKAGNLQAAEKSEKEKQDLEFSRLVSLGDQNLAQSKYDEAIANFKGAIVIKGGEPTVLAKISKAENMLANEKVEKAKNQELYNRYLAIGDENLKNSNYSEAIKRFNDALALIPADAIALSKLAGARQLLEKVEADKVKNDQEFNRLLTLGNGDFSSKDYANANANFKKALQIKYTAELVAKISETEKLMQLADNEQIKVTAAKEAAELRQKNYQEAINKADQLFASKEYAEAKVLYLQAIAIDPVAKFPGSRLKEIQSITDALSIKNLADEKLKTDENLFAEKIKIADENFKRSQWSVARFNYLEALKIKQANPYAMEKVEACDKMTDSGITDEKMKDYKNKIARGDAEMKAKNFPSARFYYRAASDILSWETYPQQQLKEIDKTIEENLTDADKKLFAENLDKGNEAFTRKEYSNARFYYNKAITLSQSDFVNSRLKEIESIVNGSESKKEEAAYQELIKKGNDAMQQKNSSIARFYFQKASQLKPEEKVPKEALRKIDAGSTNP